MVVRSTPQKQPLQSDGIVPPPSGGLQQSLPFAPQAVSSPQGPSVSMATAPQIQPSPYQPPPSAVSSGMAFHPGTTVTQSQQQPLGAVYSMVPPTATQSSALPGAPHSVPTSGGQGYSQVMPTVQAMPTLQTTASYGTPQMTGVYPTSASQTATLSGLPTIPPTISLPAVAPTISLGPAPNIMSTSSASQ